MFTSENELASRHRSLRRFGKLTHRKIAVRNPDVVRTAVYQLSRGLEACNKCGTNVANVNNRPPRGSIALDLDFSSGIGTGDQVVEYNIAPQPRACAKYRGWPKADDGELFRLHQLQRFFC